MLSLKKYLHTDGGGGSTDSISRATSLIVEGIAAHAISGDEYDRHSFQESIRRSGLILAAYGMDADKSMAAAGEVVQALAAYRQAVERRTRSRSLELQAIICMLTASLSRGFQGSEEAVAGIRGVERMLMGASELEDIHSLKIKLEECLSAVRDEGTRHEENTIQFKESVKAAEHATELHEAPTSHDEPEIDAVTGLRGRTCALSAMAAAFDSRSARVVVPIAVERVQAIKLRFGEDAASQLLFLAAETLKQMLRAEDELFFWNGGCLLGILRRQEHAELVRREVARVMSTRIELSLTVGKQMVLVPVSLAWTILNSKDCVDQEALLQQVWTFAGKRRD
ncbi:MAG: diguanylate cyclase domain-containing protein [Bryobacteraceae bacterium]